MSIVGEDGTHLDKGRLHSGNRRKSRRDRDNHALHAGWETPVRRGERREEEEEEEEEEEK